MTVSSWRGNSIKGLRFSFSSPVAITRPTLIKFQKFPRAGSMPLHKPKKPAKSKSGAKSAAGKNGKEPNGRNGRPVRPAPPAVSTAKAQLKTFELGIGLLHRKNYREAREMFEKARQGPSLEIASNAASHVRKCERRPGGPGPDPGTANDHKT